MRKGGGGGGRGGTGRERDKISNKDHPRNHQQTVFNTIHISNK